MNARVGPAPPDPLFRVRGVSAFRWYLRFVRDSVGCLSEAYRRARMAVAEGSLPWGRRATQKNVFAFGPEYNRIVLGDTATFRTTPQTTGGPPNSALRRIRHGLTAMNGEEHRQQRQLVMPLFTKAAVDGYRDAAVQITDQVISSWPSDQPVDMWRQMRRLALRTSSHVLFGRDKPAEADAMGEMIQELFDRNFASACLLFPIDLPGAPFRGLLRHAEAIEAVLRERIERRRVRSAECGMRNEGELASIPHSAFRIPHSDILDMLIQAHDAGQMSDTALLGQATILFAASYETQANTMTWTLFLLAQHPRVMADLRDELAGELRGEPPTVEQLDRLPLLDAVVKESMRILPTVPYTIRAVTTPTELGGVPLLIEDRVICSHYVTHHMPETYPDPNRFDPVRWFSIRPTPFEYLPFSAGQRVCIGRYMAMMLMKVSLAMIAQRVSFQIVPETRIDRSVKVTLGPKRGLPMRLGPVTIKPEAAPVTGNIHQMVDLSVAGENSIFAGRFRISDFGFRRGRKIRNPKSEIRN